MALSGMFLLPLDSGIVSVFIDVSIDCCVGLLGFVTCVGFTDGDFVCSMLTSFVKSVVGTCVGEAEITTDSDGGTVASFGFCIDWVG